MNKIAILLVLLLSVNTAYTQSENSLSKKEQRKLLREERKRAAEEKAERKARLVDLMMKERAFVLEADMIYDRYGNSNTVQSSINFIRVDSLYGVIQVGSPVYLGRNGVGGVTIEGEISDYKMSENKKKNTYQVNYILRSPVGSYTVTIDIYSNGNADARVSGTFSGSLRYSGRLVHPAKTRVYQGSSF